ncbi:MAG: YgjV family protein, partial [Pseudomonadota bacterium]
MIFQFLSEYYFVLAQVIGGIALVFSTLKFQFKEAKQLGIVNCISSGLWAIHNFMIGGITGAIMNVVTIARIY